MSEAGFNIKAHSIQLMLQPSGLLNPEGVIKSNLALDAPGISIKVPAEVFPWLKPGAPALVVLSVIQITQDVPVIEKPKLIV